MNKKIMICYLLHNNTKRGHKSKDHLRLFVFSDLVGVEARESVIEFIEYEIDMD